MKLTTEMLSQLKNFLPLDFFLCFVDIVSIGLEIVTCYDSFVYAINFFPRQIP